MLVSTHHTVLDGLVWMSISSPRIFAEQSNFANPVGQAFSRALDMVLFDRSGHDSRSEARRLMSTAAKEAAEGRAHPILVFPTGTLTNSSSIISFKDGAFAPGQPVQPALLKYKFRHCDPTWTFTGPGLVMLLFRLLCQVYNRLEIEFLPPHFPSEEEKQAPRKFARNVQLAMARALRVPVLQHSVEDMQLQVAALKAKLPPETGIVGFSEIREAFSADPKQVKQLLHVFKQMDVGGNGCINCEEFIDCFRRGFHEPSIVQVRLLQHFFNLLSGGQGTMDFRTFLVGLALTDDQHHEVEASPSPPGDTPAAALQQTQDRFKEQIYAQLAFAAFAVERDDRISFREFEELWEWLYPIDAVVGTSDGKTSREGRPPVRGASFTLGSHHVPACARAVFDDIACAAEAAEVAFQTFMAYTERHPAFEKRLRHAFFTRMASVHAPS